MSEKAVSEGTIQVPYYPDNVGLNTDDVKRPINMLDDLLKYLATVRKRWGNTAVTCSLQWGASALWMRSEQAETTAAQSARIAELEKEVAALMQPHNFHTCPSNGKVKPYPSVICSAHSGEAEDFDPCKRIAELEARLRSSRSWVACGIENQGSEPEARELLNMIDAILSPPPPRNIE